MSPSHFCTNAITSINMRRVNSRFVTCTFETIVPQYTC